MVPWLMVARRRVMQGLLLAWVIGIFAVYMAQFGALIRVVATEVFPW